MPPRNKISILLVLETSAAYHQGVRGESVEVRTVRIVKNTQEMQILIQAIATRTRAVKLRGTISLNCGQPLTL
jgi:hypothetical protein